MWHFYPRSLGLIFVCTHRNLTVVSLDSRLVKPLRLDRNEDHISRPLLLKKTFFFLVCQGRSLEIYPPESKSGRAAEETWKSRTLTEAMRPKRPSSLRCSKFVKGGRCYLCRCASSAASSSWRGLCRCC